MRRELRERPNIPVLLRCGGRFHLLTAQLLAEGTSDALQQQRYRLVSAIDAAFEGGLSSRSSRR